MRKMARNLGLGLLALTFAGASALAAQRGIVDADNVELLQGPRKDAPSLGKLKKGTPLDVSNYPTQGYYKVRTPAKEIGWVQADLIEIKRVPAATD